MLIKISFCQSFFAFQKKTDKLSLLLFHQCIDYLRKKFLNWVTNNKPFDNYELRCCIKIPSNKYKFVEPRNEARY